MYDNKMQIHQIVGRLTKDPELKETKTGKLILKFNIAYNTRTSTDSEGSHSNFLPVQIWEKAAEKFQPILQKGMKVLVKGELLHKRWKNDEGKIRSQVILNAEDIAIADLKKRPYLPDTISELASETSI
ncbi:MAG: single-stranded DNA-binding protein [Spirochaetia bacterium]|nr:single-stranded DNA-binding protein [Spirochaetia bacterium]